MKPLDLGSESLSHHILTTPMPAFETPGEFEGYVARIDTNIESVGESTRIALAGLRANAGEVIGKRLSARRRYFFEQGALIGQDGYTAELHYLIGDAYFLGKPDAEEKQKELGAVLWESPSAFFIVNTLLNTAAGNKALGSKQIEQHQRVLDDFFEQACNKPDEYARWLSIYLANEQTQRDRIAAGAYNNYAAADDVDDAYELIVTHTAIRADRTVDTVLVDVLATRLLSYGRQLPELKDAVDNLAVDIARLATVVMTEKDDSQSVQVITAADMEPADMRVMELATRANIRGRAGTFTRITPSSSLTDQQRNARWN